MICYAISQARPQACLQRLWLHGSRLLWLIIVVSASLRAINGWAFTTGSFSRVPNPLYALVFIIPACDTYFK